MSTREFVGARLRSICLASSLSSAATRRGPSAPPGRRAATTCAISAEVVVGMRLLNYSYGATAHCCPNTMRLLRDCDAVERLRGPLAFTIASSPFGVVESYERAHGKTVDSAFSRADAYEVQRGGRSAL